MKVAEFRPEQRLSDPGKNRVTQIPVKRGHCTRHDRPLQPRPHADIGIPAATSRS